MEPPKEQEYEWESDVAERNYLSSSIPLEGHKGIDINRLRQNEGVEFEISEADNEPFDHMMPPVDADAHFSADALGDENSDENSPFQALADKMENVTEDGGVKKLILQQGIGSVISAKHYATVHYKALLEHNDEPYDSTYLRGKPLKFIVDEGEVCPGFDFAVKTMRKSEISQFLIDSKYYLGERGCPPRVPGGVPVLFQIELKDFVEVSGIEAFYRMPFTERREVDYDVIDKVVKKECKEGKDYFSRKHYRGALRSYMKAVKALEEHHLKDDVEEKKQQEELLRLYSNLSLCHLKLNQLGSVIKYANLALNLKGTHIKAFYMKGKALHYMGEFDRAEKVLLEARKIQPKNHDVNNELQALEKTVKKYKETEKIQYQRMFNTTPSNKTAPKSNKKDSKSSANVNQCTDEFKEIVLDELQRFKTLDGVREIPFTQPNLTMAEKECISQLAEEQGLIVEHRSQNCVRIVKPNSPKDEP